MAKKAARSTTKTSISVDPKKLSGGGPLYLSGWMKWVQSGTGAVRPRKSAAARLKKF